jgi:hypothetical protein
MHGAAILGAEAPDRLAGWPVFPQSRVQKFFSSSCYGSKPPKNLIVDEFNNIKLHRASKSMVYLD